MVVSGCKGDVRAGKCEGNLGLIRYLPTTLVALIMPHYMVVNGAVVGRV